MKSEMQRSMADNPGVGLDVDETRPTTYDMPAMPQAEAAAPKNGRGDAGPGRNPSCRGRSRNSSSPRRRNSFQAPKGPQGSGIPAGARRRQPPRLPARRVPRSFPSRPARQVSAAFEELSEAFAPSRRPQLRRDGPRR